MEPVDGDVEDVAWPHVRHQSTGLAETWEQGEVRPVDVHLQTEHVLKRSLSETLVRVLLLSRMGIISQAEMHAHHLALSVVRVVTREGVEAAELFGREEVEGLSATDLAEEVLLLVVVQRRHVV